MPPPAGACESANRALSTIDKLLHYLNENRNILPTASAWSKA
jgi:hypothetical protein